MTGFLSPITDGDSDFLLVTDKFLNKIIRFGSLQLALLGY